MPVAHKLQGVIVRSFRNLYQILVESIGKSQAFLQLGTAFQLVADEWDSVNFAFGLKVKPFGRPYPFQRAFVLCLRRISIL